MQELDAGALWNLGDIDANRAAIADAGGIQPLIALLSSPSVVGVQENAAGALGVLSVNAENKAAIASAGCIPHLIALLASPSAGVQGAAAGALGALGVPDELRGSLEAARRAASGVRGGPMCGAVCDGCYFSPLIFRWSETCDVCAWHMRGARVALD